MHLCRHIYVVISMQTRTISAYRGATDPAFFNAIKNVRPLGALRIDRNNTDLEPQFQDHAHTYTQIYRHFPEYQEAQASFELESVDAIKKTVQIGAGAIGAGFLAPLIADAGHRISFLDASQPLIDRLRTADCYYVDIAGETRQMTDLHILNSITEQPAAKTELIRASMVTTSVGHNVLPRIAPMIAESVFLRSVLVIDMPVNFIFLENFPVTPTEGFKGIEDQLGPFKTAFYAKAHELFRSEEQENDFWKYMREYVGFSRAIGHYPATVLNDSPYCLKVSGRNHFIPVEGAGFAGGETKVPEMRLESSYDRLALQKLLAFNMPHALVAYLGFANGINTIGEAMKNGPVLETFEKAMEEIELALSRQFGFSEEETAIYRQHTRSIFEEFKEDTVFRVGGDAARKLSPGDRLIMAARLCLHTQVPCPGIAKGIAAGIWYAINVSGSNDPKAIVFPENVFTAEDKRDYILNDICNLDSEDPLYKLVMEQYKAGFGK